MIKEHEGQAYAVITPEEMNRIGDQIVEVGKRNNIPPGVFIVMLHQTALAIAEHQGIDLDRIHMQFIPRNGEVH